MAVPPGTPDYPGFHQVWAGYWVNGEDVESDIRPGPVPGRTGWFTGASPEPFPESITVGSAQRIAAGSMWPGEQSAALISGYPADCFPVPPEGAAPWATLPDFQARDTWFQLARLVDLAYDDPTASRDYGAALLGGSSSVVGGDSDWMPRTFFASNASAQLFWSAGSNADQLALQAMIAALGPVRIGDLAVLLLHWQAAQRTIDRLQALGYDPAKPLLLSGHSYGGIIALIVAYRIQLSHPNAVVRVVTFGMPRPGDDATATNLTTVPSVHLVNRGDPVPDLPPNLDVLTLVPGGVPPPFIDQWTKWRAVPSYRTIIEPTGALTYSQAQATTWWDYVTLAQEAIAGDPLTLPVNHSIKSYLLRLGLTPP